MMDQQLAEQLGARPEPFGKRSSNAVDAFAFPVFVPAEYLFNVDFTATRSQKRRLVAQAPLA